MSLICGWARSKLPWNPFSCRHPIYIIISLPQGLGVSCHVCVLERCAELFLSGTPCALASLCLTGVLLTEHSAQIDGEIDCRWFDGHSLRLLFGKFGSHLANNTGGG